MLSFAGAKEQISHCQATASSYTHPNVTVLRHVALPFMLSQIRSSHASSSQFRTYADRVIQLLFAEAVGREPKKVTT